MTELQNGLVVPNADCRRPGVCDRSTFLTIADNVVLVIGIGSTKKSDVARTIESIRSVSSATVVPLVAGVSGKAADFESYTANSPSTVVDAGSGS